MTNHIDIYVAPANAGGRLETLEWNADLGVHVPNSYVAPFGLRPAQAARRNMIKQWEAEGKKVAGKKYLGSFYGGLVRDLFHSKFVPGKPITSLDDFADAYRKGFALISVDSTRTGSDRVIPPHRVTALTLGELDLHFERGGLYIAVRIPEEAEAA